MRGFAGLRRVACGVAFVALLMGANLARADEGLDDLPPPRTLEEMQALPKMNALVKGDTKLPFDIRKDAIKEAAISFGARGGLAMRTFEIRQSLEERSSYLDKVFDFRQLLIPAPSGLLIEPPVISESIDAMDITSGGLSAAVADRIYNISVNAKIVSAPRTWRQYLEREWGEVSDPPDLLRPQNDEERKLWKELVEKGWKQGIDQANEIFEADLGHLTADFNGMVQYRKLLAQGMVSPPFALQVDRGVTGGKNVMRVGDRAVQITGVPELVTGYDQWRPASR